MIRFLTRVFKWPLRHSIYWAIEDARVEERALGQPVAYCHVTRDANCVPDNMARRALEARETIIFWDGEVPDDAPRKSATGRLQAIGSEATAGLGRPARAV